MIVIVDSSVWIEVVGRRSTPQTAMVDHAVDRHEVKVGDLVLIEVLQGLREDKRFTAARKMLSRFEWVTLCNPELAIQTAANYRLLRQRGITVRGTIDVIIATWCIENDAAIIHNDRDMLAMEEHLGLAAYG